MPSDAFKDPLFWPFLIFVVGLVAVAVVFAWIIYLIVSRQGKPAAPVSAKVRAVNLLELKVLLLSLFVAEELRRFLHLHLGAEGQAIVQTLPPGNLSDEALVYEVLVALQQRGLLGDLFFDALVLSRSRREPDIRRVQHGGSSGQKAA